MKAFKHNYISLFYGIYPFGDRTIIITDGYAMAYPMFEVLRNKLINHDGFYITGMVV